jgi:hypothetical protein
VRRRHPEIGRVSEIPAAAARPRREQRHRVLRALAPGQVRARRARLLSLPPLPAPRDLRGSGAVLPRRSSADGGIEEFPEFRDTARSRRASRSSISLTRASSAEFRSASITTSCACTAISPSRAASSGIAGTDRNHPDSTAPRKTTRRPSRPRFSCTAGSKPQLPDRKFRLTQRDT